MLGCTSIGVPSSEGTLLKEGYESLMEIVFEKRMSEMLRMPNMLLEEMTHPDHAHEAFPPDLLERMSHYIADIEAETGTEIRLSIRDVREAGEADLSLKELAHKEFEKLRLHHNSQKVGILLLVLYHERKFYVYGDEGVHSKIHPEAWTDVAKTLGDHFAKADFEGGLKAGLKKIEHHLKVKK